MVSLGRGLFAVQGGGALVSCDIQYSVIGGTDGADQHKSGHACVGDGVVYNKRSFNTKLILFYIFILKVKIMRKKHITL